MAAHWQPVLIKFTLYNQWGLDEGVYNLYGLFIPYKLYVNIIEVAHLVRATKYLECVSNTGRSGASCGGQYRWCFVFSLIVGQTFGGLLLVNCSS